MTHRKSATTACVLMLLFLLPAGQAQTVNAYKPHELILHLWHLDETTGNYMDDNGHPAGDPRNVPLNAFELSILNGTLLFVSSTMPDASAHGRATIPTEGIHAFQPDRWYHVAVTYDGNSQQGKLYWTEMFSGADQANLVGEFTMTPLPTDVTSSTVLAFGSGGTFLVGLIDEVRISRIARAPGDFFFGPVPETEPGN